MAGGTLSPLSGWVSLIVFTTAIINHCVIRVLTTQSKTLGGGMGTEWNLKEVYFFIPTQI